MSKNVIYPSEPCSFNIVYDSNPLETYNKQFSDIQDVLICFKQSATEEDDKYFIKYYKDGQGGGLETGDVLIDENTFTFTVVKGETDVLPVNSEGYRIFIGVLVSGLSKYLWLRVKKDSLIIVEYDGINTN